MTLWANGQLIGEGKMPHTVPVAFSSYAGMDVGRGNGLVAGPACEDKAGAMRKPRLVAAGGVLMGNQLARWFAVAVAGLNAIHMMFFVPAYPFWALVVIAADVVALWGSAPDTLTDCTRITTSNRVMTAWVRPGQYRGQAARDALRLVSGRGDRRC